MEIILWIIAIWFIWSVIKHMTKGRGIVNDLTNVRIGALKHPEKYLNGLDFNNNSELEIKEQISTLLWIALESKGYTVSNYIPGNIEVSSTFQNTVNDIYEAVETKYYDM